MGQSKSKKKQISGFNTINKQDIKQYIKVIKTMKMPAVIVGTNFKIKMINRSFLNLLGILNDSVLINKRIKKIVKKFSHFFPKYQQFFGSSNLISVQQILKELEHTGTYKFFWEMKNLHDIKIYLNVEICIISLGNKIALQLIANPISQNDYCKATELNEESTNTEVEFLSETFTESNSKVYRDETEDKIKNSKICEQSEGSSIYSELNFSLPSLKTDTYDEILDFSISFTNINKNHIGSVRSCKSQQRFCNNPKNEIIDETSKIDKSSIKF
ncbi:hypothetical protein M0812_15031 [Anaeramoeba flamelloides]|uniref:PAS domain-containing protein n=1 Tax=Anaeramoeba flamelloides TaxID=1746091 RepID=A0AAV7ZDL0_9EUKA|nr:hypothetical protein M0812_15031 [Anaeramoeba flamelloides]